MDRHLQDIINRAFPYVKESMFFYLCLFLFLLFLFDNFFLPSTEENEREREFYATRGFANPNEEKKPSKKENNESDVNKENVNKIHAVNDWVFFAIECCDESLPKLSFSHVKFPLNSTIGTLKKFISSFLFNNQNDAHKVRLFYSYIIVYSNFVFCKHRLIFCLEAPLCRTILH